MLEKEVVKKVSLMKKKQHVLKVSWTLKEVYWMMTFSFGAREFVTSSKVKLLRKKMRKSC